MFSLKNNFHFFNIYDDKMYHAIYFVIERESYSIQLKSLALTKWTKIIKYIFNECIHLEVVHAGKSKGSEWSLLISRNMERDWKMRLTHLADLDFIITIKN